MERFFVRQIEKLIKYTKLYFKRFKKFWFYILDNKIKGYPTWVYLILLFIGLSLIVLVFLFRADIEIIISKLFSLFLNFIEGVFFYPKKLLLFIYSIVPVSLHLLFDFISQLYFKIFGENSPLHFLFPFVDKIRSALNEFIRWYFDWGWYYMLKWLFILIGSYSFYNWFRFSVPKRDEEYYSDRGATLLFIYRLRCYNFKSFYKAYSEPFYDGLVGLFILFCFTFYRQMWEFFLLYVKNPLFRSKVNRWFRRKFRRPFVRFFVRFNWLFYLTGAFLQIFTLTLLNFFKLIILLSPKIFFIISILLFIFFCWLNLHELLFSKILFFFTNVLGLGFPRPSLSTQSTSTSFFTSLRMSKIGSSVLNVKLNSFVDLKSTNIHSVGALFSKLPSVKLKKLKYKPLKKKKKSVRALITKCMPKSYYSKLKRDLYIASLSHKLKRLGHRPRVNKFSSLVRRPVFLINGSKLRRLKFQGHVFIPKLFANNFGINTFILRELFLKKGVQGSGISNDATNITRFSKGPVLELYNSINNLSVPYPNLFSKSEFFFFNRGCNNFIKNRNSNILSDFFYSFLGYRSNKLLVKDSTFFQDSPITRNRTGGNYKYKNIYTYKQRSISNSIKFLYNFKLSGWFPKKNIRLHQPISSLKFLKANIKETSHWRRTFHKRFWRKLIRIITARISRRILRRKTVYSLLRKGFRLSKRNKRFRIRPGKPKLRRFIFKRFFFGKFNSKISFYQKRHKIFAENLGSFNKPPQFAYAYRRKFGINGNRAVATAIIPKSVNRLNRFNFLSLSSRLKSLRRHIVLFLRYQNKGKFFIHGSRLLVRSSLIKNKRINKGRNLRRLFSKSNAHLSFLKSIYIRNARILLAIKTISFIVASESNYLPLFHVKKKPWWHDYNNTSINRFSFKSSTARSSRSKLGFTNANSLYSKNLEYLISHMRLGGLSAPSAPRYYTQIFRRWIRRRRKGAFLNWYRSTRIKNWFQKNYTGGNSSIFFVNPTKDYRKFAFDYAHSKRSFGGYFTILPFALRFKRRFYSRLWFFFKLFFLGLSSRLSLFFIFFFGLIFGSCPF